MQQDSEEDPQFSWSSPPAVSLDQVVNKAVTAIDQQ